MRPGPGGEGRLVHAEGKAEPLLPQTRRNSGTWSVGPPAGGPFCGEGQEGRVA
jgi:hypothetical protein